MNTPQLPNFASFEYLFAASSSPWNAATSGGPQYDFFNGEKVTEGEDSNLSSFWLPAYATWMPKPITNNEQPFIAPDSFSTPDVGPATQEAEYQFYGQRNTPSFLPQSQVSDIDPFTGPSHPSPSPSCLSSVVSLKIKEESEDEDSDYLFTQGDGEYHPHTKAIQTVKGRQSPFCEQPVGREASQSPPPKPAAEMDHPSTGHRGKKDTGFIFSAKSKIRYRRGLRRNVQVNNDKRMVPIRLRGGECPFKFKCPVIECGRRMRCDQQMKRHINSHLGKGSMCPVCRTVYARIDAARRHLKSDILCGLEAEARDLDPIAVDPCTAT